MKTNGKSLRARIPATVVALGFASFFTDFSSEMIYPLLPVFLASVLGAGAVALGVIEGMAESTAAVLKALSGIWTDRVRRRRPFLLAGYGLAGLVRPLIGLAKVWPFVLAMRFLDRVGKGLRTSPRDALIADVTDPGLRGTAYGFHRSMDHAGAVVGPLVAAALLTWAGVSLRQVFLLAAIPAAVVMVVLLAGVREPIPAVAAPTRPSGRWWGHWAELGSDFRRLLLALVVFTLGNSTDAFLLLRLSKAGLSPAWVALLWAGHHLVKMGATYMGGRISDTAGRRNLVLAGWILYALIYLAFGWCESLPALIGIFLTYGIYFGLTEPVEKAWVADLVPAALRGTAFGFYHCTVGLVALPASLIFGLVWQAWGVQAAFSFGATCAVVASLLLFRVRAPARKN